MKVVFSIFILALISCACFGEEGGLKVQISQEGIDYAANVAVDTYLNNLKTDAIDDVEGTEGKLSYEIKNVKIEEFLRPEVKATFLQETHEISWSLSNIDIKASLDWKYRLKQNAYFDFRDSGHVVLSAEGLSIEVLLKIEYDEATGTPRIRTSKCVSSVDDLELNFGEGASLLYSTIAEVAKSPLQNLLTDELCKAAERALNRNANEELKTLEVETRLYNELFFNFKLVSLPSIKHSYIQSFHSGCVYIPGQYDCPTNHPVMNKGAEGHMLALSLSAESLNSWTKAAFAQGHLNDVILSSHLEDEHRHYFDTDCKSGFCIVSFLPHIPEEYPNSKLEADFTTLSPPTLSITPSNLTGHLEANVKMFVRTPNNERTELFEVHIDTELTLIVQMQENIMKFKITEFVPDIKILSVSGPEVPEEGLRWAARVTGKVLVNKANLRGQDGIPLLKMDDIRLTNSPITFEEGYLHLMTDLLYVRPSE